MIHIGICDDITEARQTILKLCEEYFNENTINHWKHLITLIDVID